MATERMKFIKAWTAAGFQKAEAMTLLRDARMIQACNDSDCNDDLPAELALRREANRACATASVRAVAALTNLEIEIGFDPRGPAVRVMLTGFRGNCMLGGYFVPVGTMACATAREIATSVTQAMREAIKDRRCPKCGDPLILVDISEGRWMKVGDRDHGDEDRNLEATPDLFWVCKSEASGAHGRWTTKGMREAARAALKGYMDELEAATEIEEAETEDD